MKIDGCKTSFLLGRRSGRCELLVSGRVTQNIPPLILLHISKLSKFSENNISEHPALKGNIGHIRHVVLIWACVGENDDDDDDDAVEIKWT